MSPVRWSSFDGAHMMAMAQAPAFHLEPRERVCPACGARALRAYLSDVPAARRPTVASFVWCGTCRRFVGSRAARPAGLTFTDPLADLPVAERRELERTLVGFLDHLDRLWDSGRLPQSFG